MQDLYRTLRKALELQQLQQSNAYIGGSRSALGNSTLALLLKSAYVGSVDGRSCCAHHELYVGFL